MGGTGSGRRIEATPKCKGAERLIRLLAKPDAPTMQELAAQLKICKSALGLYVRGRRKIPLRVALEIERIFDIPAIEWVKQCSP